MIEVAGGNPFFLREIATELREHPAADRPSVQVPPTISALLAARIDRLPPEELEVLERAAVIGGPFAASSLAALEPGSSPEGTEPVLRALSSKEFLVAADRPGNLRFRHDLTREAAYRSIPKQRRAELHERAARAVLAEGESGSAEVAGTHLEHARNSLMDLGPGAAASVAALGGRGGRTARDRGPRGRGPRRRPERRGVAGARRRAPASRRRRPARDPRGPARRRAGLGRPGPGRGRRGDAPGRAGPGRLGAARRTGADAAGAGALARGAERDPARVAAGDPGRRDRGVRARRRRARSRRRVRHARDGELGGGQRRRDAGRRGARAGAGPVLREPHGDDRRGLRRSPPR